MIHTKILNLLTALRESDQKVLEVFMSGSCYRLYHVLQSVFPTAIPLYSHKQGHWVVEINNRYYDIGGEIKKDYIEHNEYKYENADFQKSASLITHSNGFTTAYSKYVAQK